MSLIPFSWDSLENYADKYSLLFFLFSKETQIILEMLTKAHRLRTVFICQRATLRTAQGTRTKLAPLTCRIPALLSWCEGWLPKEDL